MKRINIKKYSYWIAFSAIMLLFVFIQYYGLLRYHYPVPPGHDAMMHWQMIKPIYEGKTSFMEIWNHGGYPPAYHFSVSWLAHTFNTDPMNIMLWTSPAILLLAGLAIFWFVYAIFGPIPALFALISYAFLSKTPLQQLNDGGYPNLIAVQIFMPILLLTFCKAILEEKTFKKTLFCFLSLLILGLIGITHHLSALYVIGLFLLSLPIITTYFAIKKRVSYKKLALMIILILLIFVAVLYAYANLEIFMPFRALSNSMIAITKSFPYFKTVGQQDVEALIGLKGYPSYLGGFFSIYALGGFTYGTYIFKKESKKFQIGFLLISILAAMLFFGSFLNFLSNPDRLVRDLALPMSIFFGLMFCFIHSLLHRKSLNSTLKIIIILLVLVTTLQPSLKKIRRSIQYEPMVRVTNADLSAIDYLRNQPNGKILIEGYNFYFNVFLPKWQITYLWLPQTLQKEEAHPYNPAIPAEKAYLNSFDYIYVIDNQVGSTPRSIKFNFKDYYTDSKDFTLVEHKKSQTNEIYLFRVIK